MKTLLKKKKKKENAINQHLFPFQTLNEQFLLLHSVFYTFGELSVIFIKYEIVVCNLFQFEKSLKFVFWERVKV